MSTAYRVEGLEPLGVSNVGVVLNDDLTSNQTVDNDG